MSYYKVLQVGETADAEEIRAAYLRLVREYHPDRHVGEEGEAGRARFKQIQEAYEVLYDDQQRKAYDHQRSIVPRRRPERRAAPIVTPVRRRDVPHEWLRRPLPRRRKKRRGRKLLLIACFAFFATVVIPQCGSVFRASLLDHGPIETPRAAAVFRSPSAISTPLGFRSTAELPRPVASGPAPSARRDIDALATSSEEAEYDESSPEAATPTLPDLQPVGVPDLHALEWLQQSEERDWSEEITVSATSVNFHDVLQASYNEHAGLWKPESASDATRVPFEAAVQEVPKFRAPFALPSDHVWPEGRRQGHSSGRSDVPNLLGSGTNLPLGGTPPNAPNRKFPRWNIGRPDRTPVTQSPMPNYGFARPSEGHTTYPTTGITSERTPTGVQSGPPSNVFEPAPSSPRTGAANW